MNERIKELAEQAGFIYVSDNGVYIPEDTYITTDLERFAELIRADEREACAKLCDEYHYEIGGSCKDVAATIRARGEK